MQLIRRASDRMALQKALQEEAAKNPARGLILIIAKPLSYYYNLLASGRDIGLVCDSKDCGKFAKIKFVVEGCAQNLASCGESACSSDVLIEMHKQSNFNDRMELSTFFNSDPIRYQ